MPMLIEVQAAASGEAVVGVVQGWAELVTEEDPRPTEIGLRLVPRDGPADPGQYVTIAYSGLTQVKASGPLERGARLTTGEDGHARTLQTRTLDGMEVTEGAQPIGVALEALDEGEGLDLGAGERAVASFTPPAWLLGGLARGGCLPLLPSTPATSRRRVLGCLAGANRGT